MNHAALERKSAIIPAVITMLILGGCVERTLLIRSEPGGAHVIVNGDPIGTAPVEMPFQTYGVFEVVLSLPRHQRLRTNVPVKAPWYEQIPIDFFAEVLWPWTIKDQHEVTLSLKPALAADHESIDQGEAALRKRLEQETE